MSSRTESRLSPSSSHHHHQITNVGSSAAAATNLNAPAPKYVFHYTPSAALAAIPLPPASAFIAGAVAGAASRTVVSPLERLKILLQVQPASEYQGVFAGLKKMWQQEGLRGYFRGNWINCLRIAPYSAVQFSSYELLKNVFTSTGNDITTPQRLIAGSIAGICSVVSTYPLDLVRSRLSIESAHLGSQQAVSKSSGIVGMTIKVYKEEGGVRALYRGVVPTAVGVAPYVAINFAAYELLKVWVEDHEGHQPNIFVKLACGGLAGAVSQTLTYPCDVLRRRMQVVGLKSLGYEYKSAWDAVFTIIRKEGLKGMYKGIWPNLLKVAPSIGTSFASYEWTKQMLDERRERKRAAEEEEESKQHS